MSTESAWGGHGRPSTSETARRTKHFVQLVAAGVPYAAAAAEARVKPMRALAILDEPEMRQLVAAIREGREENPVVAVLRAADTEDLAA